MRRRKKFVKFRRRTEGRTDYRKRLELLKGNRLRFVIRRFSNSFVLQVIEFHDSGDKVRVEFNSRKLKKFGWNGHCGNIMAAYLSGLALGVKARKNNINGGIADLGMQPSVKSASLYAALKGIKDAGVNVRLSEEMIKGDRIRGGHIAGFANKLLKEDKSKYEKQFSKYLKVGFKPENVEKDFEEVKNKILKNG